MPKLALSYRRQDAPAMAGRIRDKLAVHYGSDAVFMDIDSVPLGVDFREHLDQVFNDVSALLVIIGPRWLSAMPDGTPRIQDRRDYVRLEIAAALKRKVLVIPILVEGGKIPTEENLPEELSSLAYRQAAEVDTGIDFHVHVDRIIRSLDRFFTPPPGALPEANQDEAPQKAPVESSQPPANAETKASASAGPETGGTDPTTRILEIAKEFARTRNLGPKEGLYILDVPKEELKKVRDKIVLEPDERVLVVAIVELYGSTIVLTDKFVHYRIRIFREMKRRLLYDVLKEGNAELVRARRTISGVLEFDRPDQPITHKTLLDLLNALLASG